MMRGYSKEEIFTGNRGPVKWRNKDVHFYNQRDNKNNEMIIHIRCGTLDGI